MIAPASSALALIDGRSGERVTYDELHALVDFQADALVSARRGLVFLGCRNDVATVVQYLAALKAGVAVALFDSTADLRSLARRYRPERCIATNVESADQGAPVHPDLALLLTTSGSTGSPKLVRLSKRAVESNARAIAETLALSASDVAPTTLPLHYAYGLSVLNSHLVAGSTVLLVEDSVVTDAFWRVCAEHGATSLAGVPYFYQMLRRLDLGRIPTLRSLTQAGGRLSPDLILHFHSLIAARGGRMHVMYGQTEATARITALSPAELPARVGSVGRAICGGAVSIVDGEVIYSGPNVMMGYAETRDDLARGDDHDGRLATGDRGRLDDDGYLWLTGRAKRIAKVFGVRVDLDDVENLLCTLPGIGSIAAIARADRVYVFIEAEDATATATVQQAWVERTGLQRAGVVVSAVTQLPRSASGKIDYSALEAR